MSRKDIESAVKQVVGKADKDVVSLIERGISRSYDRRKFKDRLAELISDRSQVSKLTDRVLDDIVGSTGTKTSTPSSAAPTAASSSSRKRPKFEEFPSSSSGDAASAAKKQSNGSLADEKPVASNGRAAHKEEPAPANHVNGDAAKTEVKPSSTATVKEEPAQPPETSDGPSMDLQDKIKIKELMANAQKMIEERKRKLNITTPTVPVPQPVATSKHNQTTKLAPNEAQEYMQMTMQKAVRAAELKAKIANRLGSGTLKAQVDTLTKGAKAVPSMNAGNAAAASLTKTLGIQPVHTIKANIRNERAHEFKQAQDEVKESQTPHAVQAESESKHFDAEMGARPALRARRAFRFHERGEFEQLANKQRAKAKLDRLQAEISSVAKRTGISSAVKLAMAAPKSAAETEQADVPQLEWWDGVLFTDDYDLSNITEATINRAIDDDAAQLISGLVEHPIQLRPPDEPMAVQYLKVYLTKKEQKKLRRQNRKELQRERNEKIRLGLEPPPEPKMKISNLMRVLGTDAIKDPTKMEAHVRKQMAERQRKHEEANKERKLTKEQKTAKKIKKISEDVSLGVHVSVYRVTCCANPAKKFKVEMNAKQLKMTGIVLLHKDINVVIVEGGPKQQKFYRRLMMSRIKWEDDLVRPSGPDEEPRSNKCVLVWEGVVRKRAFGEFKFKACALEKQARELMEKYGVPEYWDMAYTGTVVMHNNDDDEDEEHD